MIVHSIQLIVEVVFFNDLLSVQKISAAQSFCSYEMSSLYFRGFEANSDMNEEKKRNIS